MSESDNESSELMKSNESRKESVRLGLHRESGVFPTYFIFVDLPKHIEFRAQDLPILKEGTQMEFDITLRNPKDHNKQKKIQGMHIISRSLLKYGGKRSGIVQYLEWKTM